EPPLLHLVRSARAKGPKRLPGLRSAHGADRRPRRRVLALASIRCPSRFGFRSETDIAWESAAAEPGLAWALLQKRTHRSFQILGVEQLARDLPDAVVCVLDSAVEVGADHLLGGGVGPRWTVGEAPGKLACRFVEALIGQHPIDHSPAL